MNHTRQIFNFISFFFSLTLFGIPDVSASAYGVHSKKDTVFVQLLLDSAYSLETTDNNAALRLYDKIYLLSKEIDYKVGEAKAMHYSGIVYSDKSDYPAALKRYRQALELYKQIDYNKGIGACFTNIGNLFQFQSKLDSALTYYFAAIPFYKKASYSLGISHNYGNIGRIFQQLQQFDKAHTYFLKTVDITTELNDSSALSRAFINVGTALYDLKRLDESARMQRKALEIAYEIGDDYSIQLGNINLSDCYVKMNDLRMGLYHGKISLKYALKINTPFDVADIKRKVGDLYLATNKYDSAKILFDEALKISLAIKSTEITGLIYESLQQLYAIRENFKEAYHYLKLAQQSKDSVLGEKQVRILNELEVKYETAQKDKQLAENQLQLEKNQQYIFYSIGIAIIALLLAALIFLYFYFRKRAYLKHIKTVEQEKELQVLQALMEGEEKERTRIAHNLHDEIAGMLAAAKMHANSLSEEVKEIIGYKSYPKIIRLLDEASLSVRKTAHNLMPELLMHYGLERALQKYCDNINSETLQIQFDSWGVIERFPASFELSIYRIVQELLNNIIKHSKATEALVQLSNQDELLSITVEDNGVGFDKEKLFENGMGINSLRSRVVTINGKLDVNTAPGEGASFYLEFETSRFTSASREKLKI